MMRAYGRERDFNRIIEIAIFEDKLGKEYVARPLTFVEYEAGTMENDSPTLEFKNNYTGRLKLANLIMDLVKIAKKFGIKFDEDFVKEREALNNHLQDMRALVFKSKKERAEYI